MPNFTRDRGYTRARRMGRDEEEARQDLRDLTEDPDCDFGDLLAAAISAASPEQQQEVHQALRELGEDRRGSHAWAKDRLEMRRLGRDMRRHGRDRRMGRDFGSENLTDNTSPRIEEFGSERDRGWEQGEDRRNRMGADMACDGRSNPLARLFANAARVEKL